MIRLYKFKILDLWSRISCFSFNSSHGFIQPKFQRMCSSFSSPCHIISFIWEIRPLFSFSFRISLESPHINQGPLHFIAMRCSLSHRIYHNFLNRCAHIRKRNKKKCHLYYLSYNRWVLHQQNRKLQTWNFSITKLDHYPSPKEKYILHNPNLIEQPL